MSEPIKLAMLRGVALSMLFSGVVSAAQTGQRTVQVCVTDRGGRAITGVHIQSAGQPDVLTDSTGCAQAPVGTASQVVLTRDGFASLTQSIVAGLSITAVMDAAELRQTVDVTAARTPLALDATASSIRLLSSQQIAEAPGLGLDDWLRQAAGFQLFRRTSSWVANPTTVGTSLRGLGSTAASRTLVLSDQVPLNDAFGGWVHWNEAPQLAISGVELLRGGASDLYGSSAIGGVIDVKSFRPQRTGYAFDLSGADRSTSNYNGLLTGALKHTQALAAATVFRTAGYTLIAPEVRGKVDIPSNVHSQSGRIELRQDVGANASVFLRGNLLNEARNNGTPLTPNGTRIWRYAGGGDWLVGSGRLLGRIYGTNQTYRQNFSSVVASRATETLTNVQRVPTQQLGGAVQWAQSYKAFTFVVGGDITDTRATDSETSYNVSARQRQGGVYGEVLWQPKNWSFAFSTRVDGFRSFDARQINLPSGAVVQLATTNEHPVDPRLGVVRKLGGGLSLTGSVFRAFRGPSMNELYRRGQVGAQVTNANPSLRSERATGFEFGGLLARPRIGSIRTSYFWTQVNRPIAAVVPNPALPNALFRQNLGQIVSKGVTAEAEVKPFRWMTATVGYQYANSTVTKFQINPALVDKWTASVARNMGTAQVRMERRQLGVFVVDLRMSGQQFDDSANLFKLNGYTQVDLYAAHTFKSWLQGYASVQNVAGDLVQAGRTPLLTLGIPRTLSIGVRFGSGKNSPREP